MTQWHRKYWFKRGLTGPCLMRPNLGLTPAWLAGFPSAENICRKLAGSGEEQEVDGGHHKDGRIAGKSVRCQGSHSWPGFCLAAQRRVTAMVSGLQNLLQNPPGTHPSPSVCSCWSHANKTVPTPTTITSVCSANMLTVFQIRLGPYLTPKC